MEAELKRKITALAEQLAAEIIEIAAAAVEKTLSGQEAEVPRPPPQVKPPAGGTNGAHPGHANGQVRRSDIFFG